MSGEGEGFLGRWSRLKRQVTQPEREPGSPSTEEGTADTARAQEGVSTAPPVLPEMPELPAIETIAAGSDVSAFMHPAVPESLRQAALRRLWSVDPSIRDFISPAVDYAYDWNTPGGAPGWGALGSADDVARMLGQVIDGFARPTPDEAESGTEEPQADAGPGSSGCDETSQAGASGGPAPEGDAPIATTSPEALPFVQATGVAASSGTVRTAILNQGEQKAPQRPAKRHGGALPH
ncbi:DUF3306 domain-containing protein [Alsobacter sp. R-9]